MTEAPHPDRNRRKLYGRRKGPRLSARQAGLRGGLLASLAYVPGGDPLAQFPNGVQEVWLEVGFGAGEHLVWQASHNPHIGLIGAEPYEMGMAKLLTKLDESPMNTVRLYEGDGRDIIEALPDASLTRFFLLFPDPWPKTRHHKRRFLQMQMLDSLARVLKPGGELRFATDDKSYLPYALERLMAHPAFDWLARGPSDWKTRPADWPPTRYETKAIKGPPTFLRFARR
ncbi:MAG TPA: tRNA (guanine(46)-N(7))-methyltransferase TrmB [Rhizomicrobium sp.]|jgi:tRNA (guanine-N7-)-methyltransferase|nr:tRNA (guanine(46)-N(7))-methyltransferase TrmB [Rhizomicrobium sp.]